MRSRQGLVWALGIGVVGAAALVPTALREIAALWPGGETPAPVAKSEPPPTAANPGAAETTTTGPAPATPAAAANPPAVDAAKPAATAPAPPKDAKAASFDVVNVQASGETVVAGHAAPHAAIELRDGGKTIASVEADAGGQFVILPPALAPGAHRLQLAARAAGSDAIVSEAVTIDVAAAKPPPAPQAATVAAAKPPEQAASSAPPDAQKGAAVAAASTAAQPAPAVVAPGPAAGVRVAVRSVEASEAGRLEVKGYAEPDSVVRLYLNGAYLADAAAGPDRKWSLTIEHGMSPGQYAIRADEISRADGSVTARAEVPFVYPQHPTASASLTGAPGAPAPHVVVVSPAAPAVTPAPSGDTTGAKPSPVAAPAPAAPATPAAAAPVAPNAGPPPAASAASAATPPAVATAEPTPPPAAAQSAPVAMPQVAAAPPGKSAPADVVVANLRTTTVVRGDSLWRLGRRYYGDGMRYRQIYAANAAQIRNPRLIYPGQIFVVPLATRP